MRQPFPRLFTPGNIGRMALRNRIVMPAMGTNFASATGEVTETTIGYYAARAKGGAGLIIMEHANVDYPRGQGGPTHLRIDDDGFLPGLHRVVEAVHEWGAKIGIQINHVGASARKTIDGPFAPSTIPISATAPVPKVLTAADIADIIEKFGQAAYRVKRAGFDTVQIHGGHVYLIAQFLSPYTNRRTDEYGGDLERRMKFALDVVKRARKAVGADFPVIFRLNGDDLMPDGMTLAEAKIVAKALEQASVDALDVTCGGPSRNPSRSRASQVEPISFPQGWRVYLSEEIKKAVSIPVFAVGVIREPEFAEKVLRQSKADFIAIGRGLIADPEWPHKAQSGQSARINKCISCNEGCHTNRSIRGWQLRCAVNAAAGRENELSELPPAARPKRVGVVGGGPAGMECARIAATRGHRVTLYEKEEALGGQVSLAAKPPGKDKLLWLTDYLAGELKSAGVEVIIGVNVSPKLIKGSKFDAVVIATGAKSFILDLPGNGLRLTTAHKILSGRAKITNQDIVVVGGGATGCETGLFLAGTNKSVTVVEMLGEAACGMPENSRWDLLNQLKENSVPIMLNTRVIKTKPSGLVVANGDKEEVIPCSAVVFAAGCRPVNGLAAKLRNIVPELYVIGDARAPGKIIDAIAEGNRIGRRL